MFFNYLFTNVTTVKSQHQFSVAPRVEHTEEEIGRQAANMKRNKTTFDVGTSPKLPPLFCLKEKRNNRRYKDNDSNYRQTVY